MPYCSYCDREYPEGTEECEQCHHLLLPRKPVWRDYDPNEPLVVVFTAHSEPEAFLRKGQLEQEGIPVAIQRESAGIVWGLTVDGMGAERLLVPESLAREAREILGVEEPEEMEEGEEL